MKKLLFAVALLLTGFSGFSQNTDNLLQQYIVIKNALVSSQPEVADKAAEQLYLALNEAPDFAQKAKLLSAAKKLDEATGLEKQRAAFGEVSVILWKLVRQSKTVGRDVYYQYCPMKKAYWLSYEQEIQNPYYGAAMLSCGSVVDTK